MQMPPGSWSKFIQRHLIALYLIGGLLAAGLEVSATAWVLLGAREEHVEEIQRNLYNLSLTLAEQSRETMRAADLVLSGLTDDFEIFNIQNQAEFQARIRQRSFLDSLHFRDQTAPQIAAIAILSLDGAVLAESRNNPGISFDATLKDHFTGINFEDAAEPFVSMPVPDATGRTVFYLGRLIRGRDHAALGLAVAAVNLDNFEETLAAVQLPFGSHIAFYRYDGVLLAQSPAKIETIGASFAHTIPFREAIYRSGFAILDVPADDRHPARIVAARSLTELPFAITVSIERSKAFAGWVGWLRIGYSVAALGAGLTFVIAGLLALGHLQRLRVRQAVITATQRADAAEGVTERFLATMNHEIRTPLNGILGLADQLLQNPLAATERQAVTTIWRSGRAMLAIINDVLDFSRISADEQRLALHEFSPGDLIDDLVALHRYRADAKGLLLIAEIDASLPPVLVGDSVKIGQVLGNFISNAIKFSDRGTIKVSLSGDDTGETSGQHVRMIFSVRDEGPGISEPDQAVLFADYGQISQPKMNRQGGTGLSLAIARNLVEHMGGAIGVESVLGTGSRFWFRLDLVLPDQSQNIDKPVSPLESLPAAQVQVLVVDDDEINLLVARGMLGGLKADVSSALNGATALSLCAEHKFDLIIMDINLPDIEGTEVARQLRQAAGPNQFTPIVALTATATADLRERCLALGMIDFLTKPLQRPHLYDILARLEHHRTPKAPA
jgi:signal transduction histidine kinase/ActR/RegA family two-component response regulator